MNVDMEAAQILGAASSIINTNQPQFSGITTLDPAVFATYFVKLCGVHALRFASFLNCNSVSTSESLFSGVNDFKGILASEDFRRIQNFRHIQTIDKLNDFTQWIYSLEIERITSLSFDIDTNKTDSAAPRLVETKNSKRVASPMPHKIPLPYSPG